jgi:hypothetical protein
MPWGAAIAAGGAIISGALQGQGASNAAADQEQAAEDQLGLSAQTLNAQGALSLPTREAGGLAQSREAYLLGLTPNLDISTDFSSPNITTTPGQGSSLSWNGPAGSDPSVTGGQQPVSFGGQMYGGSTPQPSLSSMYGPTSAALTSGGLANPNGTIGNTIGGGAVGPLSTGINQIAAQQGGSTLPGGAPASGVPNPNASLGASAYGSFSTPYNPSTFYQDPGYQFIQQQGLQTIQNQQATTGLALSPSSLTAALGYSSGLASQEFNNAYNRSMNTQTTQLNELNALSSGGQIATSGLSSAAGTAGAAGASALAGYGNAGAAGAIGVANAYSSGINGLTNAGMYGLNGSSTGVPGYQGGGAGAGYVFNGVEQNGGQGGGIGNIVGDVPD